jgi:hypothetical protein
MTTSAASRNTGSNASAEVATGPAEAVNKASTARKTTPTKRTTETAATATRPTGPEKVSSAPKEPSSVSARPDGLANASNASAPAKAISKAGPARKAATTKLGSEINQEASDAKMLVEKSPEPSKEERRRRIAIAAYYRAEKRGFVSGCEIQDWLDAEAEIDELTGQAR